MQIVLINTIVALVVMGVALFILNQIPMQAYVKNIINAVVCLAIVIWLFSRFGLIIGHPVLRLR